MQIPQGVTSPSKKSVCHLRISLYGLKQAPHAWFETFSDCLSTIGFTQSPYDPSLFFFATHLLVLLFSSYTLMISLSPALMMR